MDDPLLGTLIGERYRLTDVVGRGGMGIVYRAEDTRLSNRPCAVKLVLGTSNDPEEEARFERELHIIARLRSRHVVQVIDAGTLDGGRRYIVMELLEGHTLSTVLRQGGPMPVARALPLARGIIAGLAEAHEVGVVHRDLKPANIFVTRTRAGDEVARILDFGIAKETHGEGEDLTGRSVLIGTPKYMAPEQFRKQPADGRTDLYAVGLVLYEMLTGEPPFHADSEVPANIREMPDEFRIGWLHINRAPDPIEGIGPVWPLLARLLAKKPADRFADAGAVLDALAAVGLRDSQPAAPMITGELSQADRDPSSSTFPVFGETVPLRAHSARRPWRALIAAGSAGAALVAGAVWWTWDAPPPVEKADAGLAAAICTHNVESEPAGASLIVDGRVIGVTPHTVRHPCQEAVTVRIEKPGYIAANRLLALGIRDPVRVQLDARAVPLAARDTRPVDAEPDAVPADAAADPAVRLRPEEVADPPAARPRPAKPKAERPRPDKPKAERPRPEKPRAERPRARPAPDAGAAPSKSPLFF